MEMQPPEGKKFYGSVTVSERGQIVVPVETRKDFNIKAGDKLLVFGDLQQGLWIATLPIIKTYMASSVNFMETVQSTIHDETNS